MSAPVLHQVVTTTGDWVWDDETLERHLAAQPGAESVRVSRNGIARMRQLLASRVGHRPGYSRGKWRLVNPDDTEMWDSTPMVSAHTGLHGAPTGPLCAETKAACAELREALLADCFAAIFPEELS